MSVKIESYSKFKKFYTAPKLISRYPFVQIHSTTSVTTKTRYTVYMHSVPSLNRDQHEQVLQNFRRWVLFQNSTPNVHSVRHIFIKIQDEMEGSGADMTSRRYYLVINNVGRSIRKVKFAGKKTAFSPQEIGKIHHWFLRCLLVLKFLHTNNFLHMNIHPGSIFMDKSERIMLGIPGCAYKFIDPDLLLGDENLEDYLAPEILDEMQYDGKVDLFSLASVFRDVFFGDKMGGVRNEHKERYRKFLAFLDECTEEELDDRIGVEKAIQEMQKIIEDVSLGPSSGKKKIKKERMSPREKKTKKMEIVDEENDMDLFGDIRRGKENVQSFEVRKVRPVIEIKESKKRPDLMSEKNVTFKPRNVKSVKDSFVSSDEEEDYDEEEEETSSDEEEGEGDDYEKKIPDKPDFSGNLGEDWVEKPTKMKGKAFSGTHGVDWNASPPKKPSPSYGGLSKPHRSNRPLPQKRPPPFLPSRSLPSQQQQQKQGGGGRMGGFRGRGRGKGKGLFQKSGRTRGRRGGGGGGGSSYGGMPVTGATKLPSRPKIKSQSTTSSSSRSVPKAPLVPDRFLEEEKKPKQKPRDQRNRSAPSRTVITDGLDPSKLDKKQKEDLMSVLKSSLAGRMDSMGGSSESDDDSEGGWGDESKSKDDSWDAEPEPEQEPEPKERKEEGRKKEDEKEEKKEEKQREEKIKFKKKKKKKKKKKEKKGLFSLKRGTKKEKGKAVVGLRRKKVAKEKSVVSLGRRVTKDKSKTTAGLGRQIAGLSSSVPVEAVLTPEPMLEGEINVTKTSGVFSSLIGGLDDDILPPSMSKKKKKKGLFSSVEYWSESLSFSSIFKKKEKKETEDVKIEEEKIEIPKPVQEIEQEGLNKKKNYTTLKLIGQGGQSSVFFVRDNETQKEYTMKRYVSNEDEYNLEVSAMSSFEHNNVVRYHDSFEYVDNYGEKNCFVIMEYCKMGDLARFLRRQKRKKVLNLEVYSRLIGEMLTAVEQLHSLDFIHHDLKPANIFLGDSKTVKLGDFGFCFKREDLQKGKKVKGGTKKYMHSDQMKGVFAEKYLDYWSLGVILLQIFFKRVIDLKNVEKEERESVIVDAFKENEQVAGYENLRDLIMTCLGMKKEKTKSVEMSEIMEKWNKGVKNELTVL